MSKSRIEKAVAVLRAGGLVAMPTETVYGLAADASNPQALKRIFAAKERPMDHPLIVHLADVVQLADWVSEIPETAQLLAEAFWPGPLTLIFKKMPSVLDLITGHQDTVGIRLPAHPMAQALLQAFGGGLAAPSANRFGRISPTTATAVYEELGDAVDVILDGGQCEVGLESTIVDISGDEPVILRPGMITTSQISAVLHQDVYASQKNSPRVSGSLASHYAPQTKTLLVATTKISEWVNNISAENLPIVLLSYSHDQIVRPGIEWVTMPANPRQYAHDLYLRLRELDKNHFKQIVIESVPSDREWDAVRDRLQRASFNN